LVKDRGGKTLSIDRFYGNKIEMDVKGMPSSENGIPLYYHPLTEEISYCQPIPLTEEILEKNLGFENWGVIVCNEFEKYERWVLHNVIDGTSNFEVHIIYSNYEKVEQKEICFSIDDDERQRIHKTNFVHNLQNAFNLATGQELEFIQ
jgi:hypothetical protein